MPTHYGIYLIADFMQAFYKCQKAPNQLQIQMLHAMRYSAPLATISTFYESKNQACSENANRRATSP
jgi:hypothetical protein